MAPDALASFIRNSAPTLMPPYSEKVLGDADVADIHAYLVSIKKAPSAKDLPLLSNP
jgi:mono/diheme cytochrome c family protein